MLDVGALDDGTLGRWDVGMLGRWDVGTLGLWDVGTLGRWDVATLGRWDVWDVGTLDVGRWIGRTFGSWTFGRWTLDIGHWTLDVERWTLDRWMLGGWDVIMRTVTNQAMVTHDHLCSPTNFVDNCSYIDFVITGKVLTATIEWRVSEDD